MEKSELASALVDQRGTESPPSLQPWLVFQYGKHKEFQAFHNISEPDNNSSCGKFIPELKGKSCWLKNSHQGWCIILCDDRDFDYTPWKYGDCFLLNPASMKTITLPSSLYWYELEGYCFCDCVLSSPPEDGGGDRNSMVFMLFSRKIYFGDEILLFCNPGDQEWRTHKFPDDDRLEVGRLEWLCFFRGKLRIMAWDFSSDSEHLEIEVQYGSEPNILSISKYLYSDNFIPESLGVFFGSHGITYYVENDDEIFKIRRLFIHRGVYECVTSMMISKLDFSLMSWMKVTSLDDHVFFLGRDTRLCCSAKELGFTSGGVYYTQPGEISFYKYDLEDKTVMLSLPCPDLPEPWFSPNWLMILPTTLCRNGDNRRKGTGTESMLGNNSYGGNITKAVEKCSLAILPIRARTGINNDADEKQDVHEDARLWDLLSEEDIAWFLSRFLTPLDYIHLRAVCRNYRSVFPIVNWRSLCSTRCLQTSVLSPWMVFAKDNASVYSFINPAHNDEDYLMSIPELLKGATVRFSKGGWLLMSQGSSRVFFYNPFTKAIIKLPVFSPYYQFRGISFSSLPTSSDCVVFAISDYIKIDDRIVIAFIKRGHRDWECEYRINVDLPPNRTNMEFYPSINSPIFYHGSFYCLDENGTLGAFTLENDDRKWEVLSMVPPPSCGFIYESYLVELVGNLLSVLLGRYGTWVRIFRLDMSEMLWVEVEHLGRHVVFISNTSCIAKIAPKSQMENKVYFPRLQNQGILFYSLDSGTYHSLKTEHSGTSDYRNSKDNIRFSWIEPNWSETTPPNFGWF